MLCNERNIMQTFRIVTVKSNLCIQIDGNLQAVHQQVNDSNVNYFSLNLRGYSISPIVLFSLDHMFFSILKLFSCLSFCIVVTINYYLTTTDSYLNILSGLQIRNFQRGYSQRRWHCRTSMKDISTMVKHCSKMIILW